MSGYCLNGLTLVARGACDSGKRLFLSLYGVDARRLSDAELDVICASARLPKPGHAWDSALRVQMWLAAAKAGHVAWLRDAGLLFDLSADEAAAVQQALLPLLKDGDGDVRRAAAQALGAHAADPAVQQALLPLLKDGAWHVRHAAAQALGAHAADPAVQQALLPLLKDGAWHVRHAAAQALGAHQLDPAVQQALNEMTTSL